jgi:hypothetical protein
VAVYQRHADQHRRPAEPGISRGVRVRPRYDGSATIEITLDELEVADFLAALDAFVAAATNPADTVPVDESTRAENAAAISSWQETRADAVIEMVRTAVKHAGTASTSGDRYLVHVVAHGDEMTLLDGTPLDRTAAARLACDSSSTRLLLGPDWEPLALGRKTRDWTTAQRRAAAVRDGGRCRFPGCQRTHVDLHHHHWWIRGGRTDIANGFCLCPRHHTLVHDGWEVTGASNRALVFHRPDGSILGTTVPRLRR